LTTWNFLEVKTLISQRRFHIFFCISAYGGSTGTLVDGKLAFRLNQTKRSTEFEAICGAKQPWAAVDVPFNFTTNETRIILLIVNDTNIIYSDRVQSSMMPDYVIFRLNKTRYVRVSSNLYVRAVDDSLEQKNKHKINNKVVHQVCDVGKM